MRCGDTRRVSWSKVAEEQAESSGLDRSGRRAEQKSRGGGIARSVDDLHARRTDATNQGGPFAHEM